MAVDRASDNPFPSVLFREHVDPSNPDAGDQRLFVDTDHLLKMIDSSGTVTTFSTGSSGVATDAIWDTAGDLAVGSGANTAAKLPIGAVGGHLSRINGAVAWDSGTSNPGSAVAGDRYWRSDLGLIIYYDGTRWLTEQIFEYTSYVAGASASTDMGYFSPLGGSDLWLIDYRWTYNITPTHDASKYWTATLIKYEAGGATSTNVVVLTSDKSSTIWTNPAPTAIGALLGTTIDLIYTTFAKFSTASNLNAGVTLRYRRVIT